MSDDAPHGPAQPSRLPEHADSHLSVDELADLDAGLLEAEAAAAARSHLDGCPACRETQAALARLRDDLAAIDPGPMPEDVLARLEAAVRAAAEPAPAAAVTQLPDRHGRRGTRSGAARWGTPRWLGAAAAVVAIAVIGAGAFGGLQILDRDQGATTSAAAPTDSSGAADGAEAAAAGPPVTRSGTDYTAASVAAAAARLASGGPARTDQVAPSEATGGPYGSSNEGTSRQLAALSGLSAGPRLQTCIALLAEGAETALAVDLARFEGKPAALVVLPTPDDPASVDAWVVGAGCGEGGDAQVLYFRRVAR